MTIVLSPLPNDHTFIWIGDIHTVYWLPRFSSGDTYIKIQEDIVVGIVKVTLCEKGFNSPQNIMSDCYMITSKGIVFLL
jgi:hypothetical protein